MSEKSLRERVAENIVNSTEAAEILGVTRSRVNQMVEQGKIIPLREFSKDKVFWKPDIVELAPELEKLRKKYRPYEQGE
ncbi:hypothetical protein BHU72_12080 [Desulfuribacillus stibiiarsenatis]|uniref:Helix-turn-helix domain-containing protein n=1 Tax=Desulfuribacillus stibiiarsenatis TaxID=1390249 RepID=A0A1E5L810_9FIRM|nr:hypothetical protein [Desulfuribacillus stibiiarsenatis]OEH86266.1 hypothetical protein BHU72_12080 [Desulfuribacillus stibiiarsenatis]